MIGLNNVSEPDANELNIALEHVSSLDLGTTPLTNLQQIEDSLNALDQVKYGNSTGVTLTDLTNIGVIGVGGADEPTLEAVNAVLYDDDVSADHTNSVQEVVDALTALNLADGDATSEITVSQMETLGINDVSFLSLRAEYINDRISEQHPANDSGDGLYRNDVVELQALVDEINAKTMYLGSENADSFNYAENTLYDGRGGDDTLTIKAGMTIDLSAIHDIETIVLNSNNENSDTDFGSENNRITIKDILDITDGNNTLIINDNDENNDTVERVYIDASEFTTDGMRYSTPSGAYHLYTATDDSGVSIKIEENILIE